MDVCSTVAGNPTHGVSVALEKDARQYTVPGVAVALVEEKL